MAMSEHRTSRVWEVLNRPDPTAKPTDKRIPSVGDDIGEGVGGLTGAAVGIAIGSIGGPLGVLIGGLAGALGGWWTGREVSAVAARRRFEHDARDLAVHDLEARTAKGVGLYEDRDSLYELGYVASENPEYRGRRFEDIEGELRRGWSTMSHHSYGDWEGVRERVRQGFEHGHARH